MKATAGQLGSANRLVFAPFLLAVAPIVHLWAENAGVTALASAGRLILAMLIVTAIAVALLAGATRDVARAALSVTLLLASFLTFGYQMDSLGAPATPLLLNVVGVSLGLWLIWTRPPPARVGEFLTIVLVIFLAMAIPRILSGSRVTSTSPRLTPVAADSAELPDIYYVVLDGYGRADVLEELYGYDNSPFLDELMEREFYIAAESYSNYAITPLSLASTLNMRYLPGAADGLVDHDGRRALLELITDAEVVTRLRDAGYSYVHFDTLWWGTEDAPHADVTFTPTSVVQSEFETAFLADTLIGRLVDIPAWDDIHRDTLERVAEVADRDEATFTFAHVLLPHPPFVFDSRGRATSRGGELDDEWDPGGYIEQVQFVNRAVVGIVDSIIARSDNQPIILIQGDHGPASTLERPDVSIETVYWERMGILNAYLVPPAIEKGLRPDMTPVNSFRVLLRGLLDADLPDAPDASFFSWSAETDSQAVSSEHHHRLVEVTDILPKH